MDIREKKNVLIGLEEIADWSLYQFFCKSLVQIIMIATFSWGDEWICGLSCLFQKKVKALTVWQLLCIDFVFWTLISQWQKCRMCCCVCVWVCVHVCVWAGKIVIQSCDCWKRLLIAYIFCTFLVNDLQELSKRKKNIPFIKLTKIEGTTEINC